MEEYSSPVTGEEEIDLYELFQVLVKRKKTIFIIVFLGIFLGLAIALLSPKIYRSKAIILPTQNNVRPSLGALGALGELAGISLPASTSTSEIMTLLKAQNLRAKMIEKYKLRPLLFPKKWDPQQKRWKVKTEDIPSIDAALRKLAHIYSISQDRKLGTISISADFYDPKYAAWLVEILLKSLKDYISREAIITANKNIKIIEKELPTVKDPLIRQKLENLLAQNIETKVMARVNREFVFKILDPPRIPDRKIKPKRLLILAVSFVSSIFIGIFLAFFQEYIDNIKKKREIKNIGEDHET